MKQVIKASVRFGFSDGEVTWGGPIALSHVQARYLPNGFFC